MVEDPNKPATGVHRFFVDHKHHGLRLDQYLAEAGKGFSRTLARRVINIGGVHLAGRRVRRCSQAVAVGDNVEVFLDEQPLDLPPLATGRILYRDQDLIVIDKPPGMATQPTPARYQGTLYAELQNLLRKPGHSGQQPSIGMVQRLDRDTSGVMVFSIHKRAHKKMTEAFRGRAVDKHYWALVAGCPEHNDGVFSSLLARRRSTNLMVSVEKGGKPAETRYHLLQRLSEASFVAVELVTGRSHQIRAHFSEAGMPLLGDVSYGGPGTHKNIVIPRQMLHSRRLSFRHPVTAREMTFSADLPSDFAAVLQGLDGDLNGLDT